MQYIRLYPPPLSPQKTALQISVVPFLCFVDQIMDQILAQRKIPVVFNCGQKIRLIYGHHRHKAG